MAARRVYIKLMFAVVALCAYLLLSDPWKSVALVVFVGGILSLLQIGRAKPKTLPHGVPAEPMRVTLHRVGERKIEIVKVIREYVDGDVSSLLHDSLDHPPVDLGVIRSRVEAEQLVNRLASLETEARLEPATGGRTST